MNERIKELMEQTGIHVYKRSVLDKHYPELYDGVYCELSVEELEKFAELIVAECINKVRSRQMFSIEDKHNIHHAFDLLVYDLESYFGVEE